MSVGSLGSSTDLYQILQQIAANQTQPTTTVNGVTAAGTSTTASGEVQGSGHHHHHHGGGQFQSQIESAVTQALQNNNGTTDVNTVIQQAIEGVLKANGSGTPTTTTATTAAGATSGTTPADARQQFAQLLQANGVDPQKFHADLRAALQDVFKANGSTSATSTTATTGATSGTTATDPRQQFFQLLQANGVDPTQFRADLQAAIKTEQGGNSIDFSKVFASFPPGSAVDTMA